MTEVEVLIRAMCARRGAVLKKIESVASNFVVVSGFANNSYLLPVVANVFYFMPSWTVQNTSAITGVCYLACTNDGGASAGSASIAVQGAIGLVNSYYNIETESVQFGIGTFSAGTFSVRGTVLKVTYSA